MWIKHIKIRNFRAIRDIEIIFSRGINAIVGPNNAGKTSILFAIEYLAMTDISGGGAAQQLKTQINKVGLERGEELFIEIGVVENNSITPISVKINPKEGYKLLKKGDTSKLAKHVDLLLPTTVRDVAKSSRYMGDKDVFSKLKPFPYWTHEKLKLLHLLFYAETEPEFKYRDILNAHGFDINKIRGLMREFFPALVDIGTRFNRDNQIITQSYREKFVNSEFDVENIALLGSGALYLFALLALLSREGCYILMLDQPESFLHPHLQKRLIDFIRTNFPEKQVIIATHSPIIAGSLPQGNLVFLARNHYGNVKKIETKDQTELLDWLVNKLGIRPLELATIKKIVYVEGKTDVIFYSTMARKMDPLKALTVIFADAEGFTNMIYRLDVKLLNELRSKWNIEVFYIFDGDTERDPEKRRKKEEILRKALYHGVPDDHLITLSKNSLEDYLLCPMALARAFPSKSAEDFQHELENKKAVRDKKLVLDQILPGGYNSTAVEKIAESMKMEELDKELKNILKHILFS